MTTKTKGIMSNIMKIAHKKAKAMKSNISYAKRLSFAMKQAFEMFGRMGYKAVEGYNGLVAITEKTNWFGKTIIAVRFIGDKAPLWMYKAASSVNYVTKVPSFVAAEVGIFAPANDVSLSFIVDVDFDFKDPFVDFSDIDLNQLKVAKRIAAMLA